MATMYTKIKRLGIFDDKSFGIKKVRIRKQDCGAAGLTTNDYLTND